MYRFIIPTSYVLSHLLLFFILNWWLGRAFITYHQKKRWCFFLLGAILLLSLMALLGCYLSDSSFRFAMMAMGNLWLGFFFYVGLMALVLSAAASLTGFLRLKRTLKSRSHARILLAAAFAAAIPVYIYGLCHAQDVRVHEVTVDLDKEVRTGDGAESLRVVLIGDLHMSVNSSPRHIREMVDRINEQDADLVLAAGDFLTSTYDGLRNPGLYAEILRSIRSRYGAFAVYGNHDVEEPLLGGFPMTPISEAYRSEEIVSFINDCGFTVMSDDVEEVPGAGVVIVGREDGEKSGNGTEKRAEAEDLMAGIDLSKVILVLQHEPMDFKNLSEAGADLVLCGHTHAGQFFPFTLLTTFFNENNYGLKTVSGVQTLVTSGVGYYRPPMRVGTDSEVMVVTIQ